MLVKVSTLKLLIILLFNAKIDILLHKERVVINLTAKKASASSYSATKCSSININIDNANTNANINT
ncbi:MAG: hypothetical protein PV340_05080 [Wolbachia sp.]|nr:hypothetical protein [Wolbachia sp.]MDD9335986.1 hypothetical protein [Wolbachia sp.]